MIESIYGSNMLFIDYFISFLACAYVCLDRIQLNAPVGICLSVCCRCNGSVDAICYMLPATSLYDVAVTNGKVLTQDRRRRIERQGIIFLSFFFLLFSRELRLNLISSSSSAIVSS